MQKWGCLLSFHQDTALPTSALLLPYQTWEKLSGPKLLVTSSSLSCLEAPCVSVLSAVPPTLSHSLTGSHFQTSLTLPVPQLLG